ncbi:helix-turn-helix transcriptional regulator [Actinophytocola sp.]|uniref:helix-turn-helix transcriptional regulator n=1 Tax=Actinophytocola sp. TaxID=1872138 RepID=UPI00389B19FC
MASETFSGRRAALSNFLRSRRARLTPQQVGLTVSPGKRRTPGLRREEVAVLAGIGTSWYAWLEQGRDIRVSEPIARAIGRALRLDPGELAYFYRLVGLGHTAPATPVDGAEFEPVVAGWLPNPALVVDQVWNILALNRAARLVFGLSMEDANLLAGLFANNVLRARCADWDWLTRVAVARFRAATVEYQDDPALHELVDGLAARSNRFAELWRRHEVLPAESTPTGVEHPEVGRLDFDSNIWQLGGMPSVQLVLYLPSTAATSPRLGGLLSRHPGPAGVNTPTRSSAGAC